MGQLKTLRKTREFQHVFRAGKSIPGREIVLYGFRTRRKLARFGFTVSKKVGCAVVRNRLRRQLKEICRLALEQIRPGWDLVLVVRSEALGTPYQGLQESFQQQARKLGCWGESTQSASPI